MFENVRQSRMRYERCFSDKKTEKTVEENNFNGRDSQFSHQNHHLQEGILSYQQKKQKVKNKIIKQRLNSTQLYAISEI